MKSFFRHCARKMLVKHPAVYRFVCLCRPTHRGCVVYPNSVIAIVGPPRCGNTFAYASFLLSNPDVGHVAHHLHHPAQIHLAVKYAVPALVLIRDPLDIAASMAMREPQYPPEFVIEEARIFYEIALQLLESIVVSDFSTTIGALDKVVMQVNNRFGTRFKPPPRDEQFLSRVVRYIEMMDTIDQKRQIPNESSVARPSEQRRREYPRLRHQILHRHAMLVKQAREAYEQLKRSAV